jgi:hypothetical protein
MSSRDVRSGAVGEVRGSDGVCSTSVQGVVTRGTIASSSATCRTPHSLPSGTVGCRTDVL